MGSDYPAGDAIRNSGPVVAFYPNWAKDLGSVPAALMLQQLLYWEPRAGGRIEIFKTVGDWSRELCLSRRESDGARKLLQSRGLIRVCRRGCPPKLHYRIEHGALEAFLAGLSNSSGTSESIRAKRTNQFVQSGRVFRESTTETTSKIRSGTNKQVPATPASALFPGPGNPHSNPQTDLESDDLADPLGVEQESDSESARLAAHPPEKPRRQTAEGTAPGGSATARELRKLPAEGRAIIEPGINGILVGAAASPAVMQAMARSILRHLCGDRKGAPDARKRAVIEVCQAWMEIVDRIAGFEEMVKNSCGCPAGSLTPEQWAAIGGASLEQRWPVRSRDDYDALLANSECLARRHPVVGMVSMGIDFADEREADAGCRLLERCRRRLSEVRKIVNAQVSRPEAEWLPAVGGDLAPDKFFIHLFRYWLDQLTPSPTGPDGVPLPRPNAAQAADLAASWAAYHAWHIRLSAVIDFDSLSRLLAGAAANYAGRLVETIRRELFDQPVPAVPSPPPEPPNSHTGTPHPHQASLLDAINYTTLATPDYDEHLNAIITGEDKVLARAARRHRDRLRNLAEFRLAEAELKDIWSKPNAHKRLATMLLCQNPRVVTAAKTALEIHINSKDAPAGAAFHGGPDNATAAQAQDQPCPTPTPGAGRPDSPGRAGGEMDSSAVQ